MLKQVSDISLTYVSNQGSEIGYIICIIYLHGKLRLTYKTKWMLKVFRVGVGDRDINRKLSQRYHSCKLLLSSKSQFFVSEQALPKWDGLENVVGSSRFQNYGIQTVFGKSSCMQLSENVFHHDWQQWLFQSRSSKSAHNEIQLTEEESYRWISLQCVG